MCKESLELEPRANGFSSWASGIAFQMENFGGISNYRSTVRDELLGGYKNSFQACISYLAG